LSCHGVCLPTEFAGQKKKNSESTCFRGEAYRRSDNPRLQSNGDILAKNRPKGSSAG